MLAAKAKFIKLAKVQLFALSSVTERELPELAD